MRFRYPSYRRLVKYLGEADAMVEITELAVRHFISEANGRVESFVRDESTKYGVTVNLSELTQVREHLSRHYIEMVYESAERFLKQFRREHSQLHNKDWIGDSEEGDRLSVCLQNLNTDIDQGLVDRFQYYRLVRNWIVHEGSVTPSKAMAKFNKLAPLSPQHAETFATTPGPNAPDELTFDDFVLFSRITKRIAELLSAAGALPRELWPEQLDLRRFRRLLNNPKRMRNAVTGHLRTEYGMDKETAGEIAKELQDSLA